MTGEEYPRPRTVVWVGPVPGTPGRWRVRVAYPAAKPVTLLSTPDVEEAKRAARGYAAKYNWLFVEDES